MTVPQAARQQSLAFVNEARMQPEDPPPGCFWQTVGRPITPEQLECVHSQGREAQC
jgi:hypothetical protein